MGRSQAVPYLRRDADDSAGLDLGLPFDSPYGRKPGTEVDNPEPTTLSHSWRGGRRTLGGSISPSGSVL